MAQVRFGTAFLQTGNRGRAGGYDVAGVLLRRPSQDGTDFLSQSGNAAADGLLRDVQRAARFGLGPARSQCARQPLFVGAEAFQQLEKGIIGVGKGHVKARFFLFWSSESWSPARRSFSARSLTLAGRRYQRYRPRG